MVRWGGVERGCFEGGEKTGWLGGGWRVVDGADGGSGEWGVVMGLGRAE